MPISTFLFLFLVSVFLVLILAKLYGQVLSSGSREVSVTTDSTTSYSVPVILGSIWP